MDDSAETSGHASEDIPASHLAVALSIIVLQSLVARALELGNADILLIAGIRAFVQLIALGFILAPIFSTNHPLLVLAYIFGVMITISAHEASARPKVTYPGMFWKAYTSLSFATILLGGILVWIVDPDPWYNAQYLIPMAGMLVNNALSGAALALHSMIDYLYNGRQQVEVLLAFGATPWEASWPGFVNSVHAAMIPTINGMNVLGIVAIPGMMTGQILGGASPTKAAHYQIVISFMISASSFLAVCNVSYFTVKAFFDSGGRHDTSKMTEQSRVNISNMLDVSALFKKRKQILPQKTDSVAGSKTEPLLQPGSSIWSSCTKFELRCKLGDAAAARTSPHSILDFCVEGSIDASRTLHASLSLDANRIVCIMGPSGSGKTTLLKWISDLAVPSGNTSMSLQGTNREAIPPTTWRQKVLYLHQIKAPLPGSPKDLCVNIEKLKVNKDLPELQVEPIIQAIGLDTGMLERPWKELSGGESQRMMLAIALSTRPTCILLDEPTSALDEASKALVEAVLRNGSYAKSIFLVTHDPSQAGRLASSTFEIVAS